MKKLSLLLIICFSVVGFSYGQHPEIPNREQLEQYNSYIHKFEPKSCWKYVYYLIDGLVIKQENYCKRELMHRTEFKYDSFGNVISEIDTYDFKEGKKKDTLNHKLEYNDSLLVLKEFDFGTTEKYFDFNESGKPKLIERIENSAFKTLPYKEMMKYNKKGNVIISTEFSIYEDLNGKTVNEKATTYYKYDDRNNEIEIHREYEPKQEFPIPITGGPFLYEYEYFRYKYNKNGLWTKKYKTVDGKEYLRSIWANH